MLARLGSSRGVAPPLLLKAPEEQPFSQAGSILSERETQILRGLIEGQSNKTIARTLDIMEATVKVHVKAILRKTGVQNRTQAAIWALGHLSPAQFAAPEAEEALTPEENGCSCHRSGKPNGH